MLAAGLMLLGLAVLYFGAEWLVSGASELANQLGLSKSFVGLTIVALGTSAPELFVNTIAASRGLSEFTLANIAGSNLTNICLGFGIGGILATFPLRRSDFLTDLVFVVLAPAVVLGSFLLTGNRTLSLWILLPFAVLLAVYLVSLMRRHKASTPAAVSSVNLWLPLGLLVLGILALYGGGELVVRSAIRVSESLGIRETIIGLTIVAAGTSVPDVFATVTALRRKEYEIGVGNILGSNISNIFIVLGSTLVVSGRSLSATVPLVVDYAAVVASAAVFIAIVLATQRVTRLGGIVLVVFFLAYMGIRVGVSL